ncbi:urate oxidase [Micrococcales bacterium 31B]|nr:urate oxidase [Micrococcales bacterium 31B]
MHEEFKVPTTAILGSNQYGKAEVHVVKVKRDTARHEISDLTVTSQLRGDFAAAHTAGDNAHVVATDTQKNTIFAFARDGMDVPEEFLIRLSDHFTAEFDWVSGGRWEAQAATWARIPVQGAEHDHAFYREGSETRTAVVVRDADTISVIAGLTDLVVLKSTESEFVGFPRDKYTTLAEATDRILATTVTARWRFADVAPGAPRPDYDASYAAVRAALLETFASKHSKALQTTLFEMGEAALAAEPGLEEIKFSLPNKHHFTVDLTPFGLDNPNEVFYAADRPYGLIEATVLREGVGEGHAAWSGIAGFC